MAEPLERRLILSITSIHAVAAFGAQIAELDGAIYFTGTDTDHGNELWKSDGTKSGSTLFKEIAPGPAHTRLLDLEVADGLLYFVAATAEQESLWRTDGTQEGTFEVYSCDGYFEDVDFDITSVGSSVFFLAPTDDRSLWVTDGTTEGTHTVATDILKDVESMDLASYGGNLYFTGTFPFNVGDQLSRRGALYATDGTTDGTVMVDSLPDHEDAPKELIVVDGKLFFRQYGGYHDVLWTSLGTTGTTTRVGGLSRMYRKADDLHDDTWRMWTVGNRLVLGVVDWSGTILYTVDLATGKAPNFAQVALTSPAAGMVLGGYLYLHGPDGLTETDGTAEGTRTISNTENFYARFRAGGVLYLSGSTANYDTTGLWKLADSSSTPVFVDSAVPFNGVPIMALNGSRYFLGGSPDGNALYRQDPQLASIAGVVYHDLGDALSSPATLPGIILYADLNANGKRDSGEPFTKSGAKGEYTLVVKPGTYKVGFVGPSRTWKQTSPREQITVLADQQSKVSISIVDTARASSISGHVFRDVNRDGNYDDGEGFPDAQVYIDLNKNNRHDAVEPVSLSDASGSYSFSDLLEGQYAVRIISQRRWYFGEYDYLSGYNPLLGLLGNMNIVAQSNQIATLDLRAFKKARLTGFVFNDLNANAIRDPGEPGLAGQSVSAVMRQEQNWGSVGTYPPAGQVGTSVTDLQGFYSLLVPPREFYLSYSTKTGMRTTLAPSFDAAAAEGAAMTADIGFTEKGKLSGNLSVDYQLDPYNDDPSVLTGWRLVLTGSPETNPRQIIKRSALTDANGKYEFGAVLPGTYTLRLEPRDPTHITTNTASYKVTIPSGNVRNFDFAVARIWSVEGKAFGDGNLNKVNDPGESLADVLVFGDRDGDRRQDADEPYTKSDKNGKYKLNGLTGNQANVVFVPPEGWRRKRVIHTDRASAGNAIDMAFTNTAQVAGFVFFDADGNGKDDDGEHVLFAWDRDANWRVWVDYDNDGVFDTNEPTARSTNEKFVYGDFWIDNVPPGKYWVRFQNRANTHVTTASSYKVELKAGHSSAAVRFGYR